MPKTVEGLAHRSVTHRLRTGGHMSHTLLKTKHLGTSILCLTFLSALTANAGEITKVNTAKKQVMIELSDEDQWTAGDQIYAVSNGKKHGLIEITKIKGKKALGTITKGKAEQGDSTQSKGDSTASSGEDSAAPTRSKKSKFEAGVLVGFATNGQTVKTATSETVKLAGNGMSLKGMGDMPLMGKIGLRVEAGLEQFSVKKSLNSVAYETSINYLDLGVALRYRFLDGATKLYVALGMNILLPMTKKVNGTVDAGSVAATTVLDLKAGAHFPVGKKYFIPVQIDYLYFPPSSTVTTSIIAGRTGFGMFF